MRRLMRRLCSSMAKMAQVRQAFFRQLNWGLTGSVQSLWRADPNYARQLLHRSTIRGNVTVKTIGPDGEQRYEALLDETGERVPKLHLNISWPPSSEREPTCRSRCWGSSCKSIRIQDSDADSPLAKFVGDLLGLDRLDALEVGLKPLTDVRNVRKIVEGWSQAEIEKNSVDKLLEDQRRVCAEVVTTLGEGDQGAFWSLQDAQSVG